MAIREDLEKSLKELDELIKPYIEKLGKLPEEGTAPDYMIIFGLADALEKKNSLKLPYDAFVGIAKSLFENAVYVDQHYEILKSSTTEFIHALNTASSEFRDDMEFGKVLEAGLKSIKLTFEYNEEKQQARAEKILQSESRLEEFLAQPFALLLVEAVEKYKAAQGNQKT